MRPYEHDRNSLFFGDSGKLNVLLRILASAGGAAAIEIGLYVVITEHANLGANSGSMGDVARAIVRTDLVATWTGFEAHFCDVHLF